MIQQSVKKSPLIYPVRPSYKCTPQLEARIVKIARASKALGLEPVDAEMEALPHLSFLLNLNHAHLIYFFELIRKTFEEKQQDT